MNNEVITQMKREQRRRELFVNKSTHMTQRYLRRVRELGGAPEQMQPFFDALERTYVHGQDVQKPHGIPTVGTYCVQVPAELVYAAGAQPVKLCSGHYTAFSIGDDVVARDACPLVKAVAGFKHMGTLPIYENCSLMVVPITCDCKKKIAGLLQDMCPVHVLPIPANKEDEDVERYVDELYRLAHAISQHTGQPVTYESLVDAFNRTGRAQFELSRFLELKRAMPGLLYGTHAMAAMNAASYLDADAWACAMGELNHVLEQRGRTGERAVRKDVPRIMLTGSPIVFPNLKIPLLVLVYDYEYRLMEEELERLGIPVIRLEVDLADQPEEQEWIDSTNRQVSNMRRLVDDLITLSKMEEQGAADLVFSDVSLSDVAFECVLTFGQVAHASQKKLIPSIDEDVFVKADEPAVRQLMQILIDNAIKYATGDGTIQIEVKREGRSAIFATRNQWDHGVDVRELSSLFDRFVRGEQSRDRSDGASGYGLGLSIARAIAQRNNAKLEVTEDAEGRIVFLVIF